MDRAKESKVRLAYLGLVVVIVIIFGSFPSQGGLAEAQQTTANNPATGRPTITKSVVLVSSLTPGYPSVMGEKTITGMVQVGDTLAVDTSAIADADGLENATFRYRWVRSDSSSDTLIEGTTDRTYTLVDDDNGKVIQARVTFTDDAGNEESLTSYAVEVETNSLSWLSVSDGSLTPAFDMDTTVYTVPDVPNATSRITLIAVPKAGYQLVVVKNPIWGIVKACSGGCYDDCALGFGIDTTVLWDAEPFTPGFQLELEEGNNQFAIYSLTGYSSRDDFGSSYTLTVTREASEIRNAPATGAPTITGTAQVGETLTAGTSAIADADGLENATFSYQWLSSRDAEISGATGSTYTLVDDDEGKVIKVQVVFTDDAGNEETLTSTGTSAVAARPNAPATGAPTITGTAQVGETLTAGTSAIADADGLENATFSYQWLSSRDAEISGATGSTYTLVDDDEGKVIKVQVVFTDDAGNEETLTSTGTSAVAARPPLTASFLGPPQTHNGQTPFTFELRFSEEFGLSYVTLRDHAFVVTGGTVNKSRRLDRSSNLRWQIEIEPTSDSDVTVVLPVTTDCDAQGAICTGDGRKLSNRLEFNVRTSGP